jgi:polar amino acid transport system substrate-binding protein
VEVVREIMRVMDIKYEINVFPGARGERMLDYMPNIVSFSLFRTPEREDKYHWIGPISDETIYFYKRRNDPRIFNTIEDIKKAGTVVVYQSGLVQRQVKALGITNVMKVQKPESQFRSFMAGRGDLIANAIPIRMKYYLESVGLESDAVVSTGVAVLKLHLYIATSKETPIQTINQWKYVLDYIVKSGKYAKIYARCLQ